MSKDSYKILQQRWSNVELLRRAADLRDHLSYEPIHFSEMDEETAYIISLLPQAHNAYYMGHLEACIAVCGSLLEAFLAKRIADEVRCRPLNFQRRSVSWNFKHPENVQHLALNDLSKIVGYMRWLNIEDYANLHNIKELRNRTLHGRIPLFAYDSQNGVYICELAYSNNSSREIEIPEEKVLDIDEPPENITAWYCLKHSHDIIQQLMKTRETLKDS